MTEALLATRPDPAWWWTFHPVTSGGGALSPWWGFQLLYNVSSTISVVAAKVILLPEWFYRFRNLATDRFWFVQKKISSKALALVCSCFFDQCRGFRVDGMAGRTYNWWQKVVLIVVLSKYIMEG